MIEHSGVYVRARGTDGKWGSCLAEQLDDESFRLFVLDKLRKLGAVDYMADAAIPPLFARIPLGEEDES